MPFINRVGFLYANETYRTAGRGWLTLEFDHFRIIDEQCHRMRDIVECDLHSVDSIDPHVNSVSLRAGHNLPPASINFPVDVIGSIHIEPRHIVIVIVKRPEDNASVGNTVRFRHLRRGLDVGTNNTGLEDHWCVEPNPIFQHHLAILEKGTIPDLAPTRVCWPEIVEETRWCILLAGIEESCVLRWK